MATALWQQLLFLCLSVLHAGRLGVPPVGASETDDIGQRIIQVPEGNWSTEEVTQPDSAVTKTELALPVSETEGGALDILSPEGGSSATAEAPHNGREDHQESPELQRSDPGEDCNQTVPPERKQDVAEAVMQLGVTLLRELELQSNQENLLFSPFSVSLALAHLALGAANQTEKDLLEALHMASVSCLHPTLQSLTQDLRKSVISIATSLYMQKGFTIKEKFLEESERFYGAKPATLSGNSEADLAAINSWVKKATNGQISSMLSELPANVVMVLLNAVHFRGFWKNKFDPLLTEPSLFHLDEELAVSVEMMKARTYPLSWFTLDSLDVQVAKFPFKGNTSFVVILPNYSERNFSQLLTNLSKANLQGPFPKERPTVVKMPKLDLQSNMDVKQIFNRLGILQFSPSSDFSPMADGPLFVSSIQHRAALELNEAGVEASAATSVIMHRSMSTFFVDRPFLFIIFDDETNIPLFLGTIRNPNPGAPQERKTEGYIPTEDPVPLLTSQEALEKP